VRCTRIRQLNNAPCCVWHHIIKGINLGDKLAKLNCVAICQDHNNQRHQITPGELAAAWLEELLRHGLKAGVSQGWLAKLQRLCRKDARNRVQILVKVENHRTGCVVLSSCHTDVAFVHLFGCQPLYQFRSHLVGHFSLVATTCLGKRCR